MPPHPPALPLKTFGFLMLSNGIKREYWEEMSERFQKHTTTFKKPKTKMWQLFHEMHCETYHLRIASRIG